MYQEVPHIHVEVAIMNHQVMPRKMTSIEVIIFIQILLFYLYIYFDRLFS